MAPEASGARLQTVAGVSLQYSHWDIWGLQVVKHGSKRWVWHCQQEGAAMTDAFRRQTAGGAPVMR